jgi:hypothetical protein
MKRKLQTELDRNMVISYIQRLDIKTLYTVEVLQKKSNRSISQNSLYWLWLCCIEFETGTDREYLHELFKRKFLPPETTEVFGEQLIFYSTKNKDTLQFKHYLDKIQIFASVELSITLPDPNDKYWQEFYEYYIAKL